MSIIRDLRLRFVYNIFGLMSPPRGVSLTFNMVVVGGVFVSPRPLPVIVRALT